jgi:phosphatidate cytidylyltransferase
MTRLVTSAFLIPAVWYLCKRAPFPLFLLAAALVIGVAAWEAFSLTGHRGARPLRLLGLLACLALGWAFAGLAPSWPPVAPLAALIVFVPLFAMLGRDTPESMFDTIQATLVPVAFVGLGSRTAWRCARSPVRTDPICCCWPSCVTFADTGAYYVGSAFGKHRLAPSISPKKSWEERSAAFWPRWAGVDGPRGFFQRLPWVHALVLGTLLCAAGIVGDLAESVMKRAAGVKDSSGLLPGHGGMLDRVDSMIVAAPVLYYYWRVVLQGALT